MLLTRPQGLSLAAAGDAVGHAGQAVTMPAARGQHLFTRTKRHLMEWARDRGLAGIYSESTAAHPYSQRANIELGAHETGFLLGWIPATVANDAAEDSKPRRQSVAIFYAKLNELGLGEMTSREPFTRDEARQIGEQIGIDWSSAPFDVDQFQAGMNVELEHGLHDSSTNVTDDNPLVTGKIALAHLNEFADYYTRLEGMEEQAKRDHGIT